MTTTTTTTTTTTRAELVRLQDEMQRARRAFAQNPTPALGAAIEQLAGKIRYRAARVRRAERADGAA